MTDDRRGLPRRQLFKLSGAVGAVVLATSVVEEETVGAVEPGGASPYVDLCGSPTDTGPELWARASKCWSAFHAGTPPDPSLGCRGTTDDWVVFNGATAKQSWLLVASKRVKGIECPKIWASNAPNYWAGAWAQAQPAGAGPVSNPIGLGINSANDRSQPQFHIHMATLLSGIPGQLQALEKQGAITKDLSKWSTSIVEVEGLEVHGGKVVTDYRAYRAVWVNDLQTNLFETVRANVPAAKQDMSLQAMVVTARLDPTSGKQVGFYVLNSDRNLRGTTHGVGGIGAVDQLFNWG